MARDWTDLLAEIISHYPTAAGSGGQDTLLARAVTKFLNSLLNRIETDRRWSLNYVTNTQVTTQGVQLYTLPTGMNFISHMYWVDTAGNEYVIDSYDVDELRRRYGVAPLAQQGTPKNFAIVGNQFMIFPAPDLSGPTSGNYTLYVEGYQRLTPLVVTTGTFSTGTATTLTVPSTGYLTSRNVPTAGTYLSISQAGYLGEDSINDTLITPWTAFGATTVTITNPVQVTNAVGTKCYFNSFNWVIDMFDQVVLFGVLRDVAAYQKENFQVWEQRYQEAYDDMARADADRRATMEMQGVAVTGQKMTELSSRARGPFGYSGLYWGW